MLGKNFKWGVQEVVTDSNTATVGGAASGDVGVAAIGDTVTCGSACSAGNCGAYTTACLEANLMSCSTEIEPFLG